ncbi:hypothetical protein SCLCIDRAFT_27466 [Scleroderma citrinum Foug A]|uniref:Cytochrome P450 n=1 Tax=Scleroderma citrinum Foug A TaxID=1036808 RepID=A0A0C3DSK9_9AGAM|nr:hypothetical protein SCLCIDRAFT_27466 [Scleroderma citrinum Foug A]
MDFSTPATCSALLALLAFVALRAWQSSARRRGLRSLPGPKGLPFIGNLLDINLVSPWLTYAEWGKRYVYYSKGGIVHCTLLGRDFVIINDERIVHELLEQRSAIYADRPSLSFVDNFGLNGNTVTTQYGNRWRLHRKMFNFTFNKPASTTYRPMQTQKVRQMLQRLIATPQDYVKHVQAFSGSVIMAITYGYNAVPENDPFVSKAMQLAELVANVVTIERAVLLSTFPILSYIPSWLPGGRYKRWAAESRSLSRKIMDEPVSYVKQNMTAGSASKSLVNDLLSTVVGEDTGFNHEEVVKEVAASAFLAGQDTTFSTILVFILAMTLYPEVQIKAQKEIDRVVGQDRLPDFCDRENLPYIEGVFLETLRWKPVIPLGVPYLTRSDDVYDGMYIPKGSTVLLNTWYVVHWTLLISGKLSSTRAITQDGGRYPSPNTFTPERHLNADGKIAKDFSAPVFGSGRRICPGRYVGEQSVWAVVVSILATLCITKAKDELGNEVHVQPEFTTGLVIHPKPFPCSIEARSTKAAQLIRANMDDAFSEGCEN